MGLTKKEVNKKFIEAVRKSHGKTNNSYAYQIADSPDSDVDDIVKIASYRGDDDYYNKYGEGRTTRQRQLAEKQESEKRKRGLGYVYPLTLADYKWFFKDVPEDLLPDEYFRDYNCNIISATKIMEPLLKLNYDDSNTNTAKIYQFNKSFTLVKNGYPNAEYSKSLLDSGWLNKYASGTWFTYNTNMLSGQSDYGISFNMYGADKFTKSQINALLDLCSKIDVLVLNMIVNVIPKKEYITSRRLVESKQFNENNDDTDLLFEEFTKNNNLLCMCTLRKYLDVKVGNSNYYDKYISQMYNLCKTLEYMTEMGIGVYSKRYNYSISKFSRFMATVKKGYKLYKKSKPTEWAGVRQLLLKQLNVISNDCGGNIYDFGEFKNNQVRDELAIKQYEELKANKTIKSKSNTRNKTNGIIKPLVVTDSAVIEQLRAKSC